MQVPHTEVIIRGTDGALLLQKAVPPGDYVLGRAPECEMAFEADLVSRRHAQLTINFDHALIEDLGSSNGTFVNGKAVAEPTRLWPNQKIRVGAATVELRRVKTVPPPDVSLAPSQAAVQRLLPEELLREKKYAIGGVIAQGGMGAILDAKDSATERTVAMKVMLDGSSPDELTRFVAEAKVTAQLEHPNIVPVHELSVDDNGQPFYTMKMVRGVTLKKVLDLLAEGTEATAKKYPLSALLTIYQKLCDAVAFAHSKGVIHRDLKPENVMLGDFGEVLVMDWGLAKVVGSNQLSVISNPSGGQPPTEHCPLNTDHSAAASATLAGTIMGTPQYMSPEQARGEVEDLDVRSDLYALGAILYHILALRPPVAGRSAMEIVDKVGRGEIDPLDSPPRHEHEDTKGTTVSASFVSSSLRGYLPGSRIPDSLAAVARKAMAFERDQRYWSVEELQADLTAYQSGFATRAENAGLGKQLLLALKRHKVAAAGAVAVLVVGATFGAKALVEGRRAEREAVRAQREAARANQALNDLKKSAPALLALAESEAGFQRFDSALEKLEAALALDPALTSGWWRRAWLFVGLGRYGEAATAFRAAQQRDPAQHTHDAFLPVLDALATAPDDTARFTPERTDAIFKQLTRVGASGELNALSKKLTLGAKQKEQLVRNRLAEWLGKNVGSAKVQSDGTIKVWNLPRTIDTLEPLRGLPIGDIELQGTAIRSLEPLRGMALRNISFSETRISDLSPLGGMALTSVSAANTDLSDLKPLAGMPLRKLSINGTPIHDLGPLRGCPLESLNADSCKIVDLSPLRGAPLKELDIIRVQCSDLSFLIGAPLEVLNCGDNPISDLSPLRGMPLKHLDAGGNPITDLRPLAGLPLTELNIEYPITDYAPLRELRQLEKLRLPASKYLKGSIEPLREHPTLQYIALGGLTPFRPVAEFWKEYDAQQAAEKK